MSTTSHLLILTPTTPFVLGFMLSTTSDVSFRIGVHQASLELDISPTVIRNGSGSPRRERRRRQAREVLSASHMREAYAEIRQLTRGLRRKTMELGIPRAIAIPMLGPDTNTSRSRLCWSRR